MSEVAANLGAARPWAAPELATRSTRPGPTVQEIDDLVRAAHDEAYARGHDEGFQHGMTQAQAVVDRLLGVVENLRRPLEQLDRETLVVLTEFAGRIAGALVRDTYHREPERLVALIEEVLHEVPTQTRALEVRLSPDDAAAVGPMLARGGLSGGVRVINDASLKRGDLRVHADAVRIDASIDTRIEQMVASLRAEPGA